MIALFRQRPWLWVVVAFLILFAAWGAFFTLAIKFQPEKIEAPNADSEVQNPSH
ncbi:MAG: hypothetical protein KDM91_21055 [Verrucomicrobiae bacterium]|nr:hypothetical protein [Verrucomicrobiae bacterium]MCP5541368.1 hypothetical protein [Akkermansiaceae bacterium]